MRQWIIDVIRGLSIKITIALLYYLISLIGISSLLLGVYNTLESQFPQIGKFTTYFLVAGICLLVGVPIRFYQNYINKDKEDFNFRILHKEAEYSIHSIEKHTSKLSLRLKSLKNGLNSYSHHITWTGDDVKIASGRHDHKVLNLDRVDLHKTAMFLFGKTLKKGAVEEVILFSDLENTSRKAIPFLSFTIKQPTDTLNIKLNINPALNIKSVLCSILPNDSVADPIESDIRALDSHGSLTWKIDKPEIYYRYRINWDYAEN